MDTENTLWNLGEAVREAIDHAYDAGLTAEQIKAEISYQVDNYDWDA